jgi:hypothetical protein
LFGKISAVHMTGFFFDWNTGDEGSPPEIYYHRCSGVNPEKARKGHGNGMVPGLHREIEERELDYIN